MVAKRNGVCRAPLARLALDMGVVVVYRVFNQGYSNYYYPLRERSGLRDREIPKARRNCLCTE